MNITKFDIVNRIAKETGISKVDAKTVVDGVLKSIINAVADGHRVELRGFGVFGNKKRNARQARNPRTGASVELRDRCIPTFKASTHFTKIVDASLIKK